MSKLKKERVIFTDTIMQVKNLSKIYNCGEAPLKALDEVSLVVNKGEFVAIVGASGSGKSTLMNILGCLDSADSGEYLLLGKNISNYTSGELSALRSREIGFVFQSFHLIGTLSALENVELPLLYLGYSPKQRREKAKQALDTVGLSARAHHKPKELSGGQQQRVAIARAIVTEPSILLADEPTGNLDSEIGAQIMNLLHSLNKSGKTVVLITHDKDVARSAQRQILVSDGKIKSFEQH